MRFSMVLLALFVAWNADIEALPLDLEGTDTALLQESSPTSPDTPETKAKQAMVDHSKGKVAQALAAVHATGTAASTPGVNLPSASAGTSAASASASVSSSATPHQTEVSPVSVATPAVPISEIAQPKAPTQKPDGKDFVNRDTKAGDKGFINQQAEAAVKTADQEMHGIEEKLRDAREAKYERAAGAQSLLAATQAASAAASAMATEVREEEASNAADAVRRVLRLKKKILTASSQERPRLQIKLAKAKRKRNKLLAKARSVGQAASAMVLKAGSIEGRADALVVAKEDGSTELQQAMLEHAKAKMALESFEKENNIEKTQKADDKKTEKHFEVMQQNIEQQVHVANKEFSKKDQQSEEADHKAEVAAAESFARKAKLEDPKIIAAAPVPLKTSSPSPSSSPSHVTTYVPAASTPGSAQAAAQAAVQAAHATGTPEAAKAARTAIAHYQNVKNAHAAAKPSEKY